MVKDLALSSQQLRSLLRLEFSVWPGNFHVPQARQKKKVIREHNIVSQLSSNRIKKKSKTKYIYSAVLTDTVSLWTRCV